MKIAWQAQPKQAEALVRNEDEILYGGARGGGKSDAGRAWLLYDIKYPFYRALVIRKNATDLGDWIDKAQEMYRNCKAKKVSGKLGTEFHFPSGAKIRTGHLADEEAFQKYQGHEYQKVLIEELSHIAREKDYMKLISSCRSSHAEIKPQVFATTNPDEPGLDWIKARWGIPDMPDFDDIYTNTIDVEFPVDGVLTKATRHLVFVPAKLEDNPKLTIADPNYIVLLESFKESDPDQYEAWRKGNWKGFGTEGAYYRAQVQKAEEEGRITNVPYDERLDVYTWCDLGVSDSFSIGYFQLSGKQWRMIDYDEFEGETIGSAIQHMREKEYDYADHFAPHDIEVRDLSAEVKGATRHDVAKGKGVDYKIVPKLKVAEGINAVRMNFSQLWIDKTKCALFLRRIRNYHKEFDEKRGIYKDNPVHDISSHGADMLRYWAVSKDTVTYEAPGPTSSRASWVSKRWKK
jgi:hypothetical protein